MNLLGASRQHGRMLVQVSLKVKTNSRLPLFVTRLMRVAWAVSDLVSLRCVAVCDDCDSGMETAQAGRRCAEEISTPTTLD